MEEEQSANQEQILPQEELNISAIEEVSQKPQPQVLELVSDKDEDSSSDSSATQSLDEQPQSRNQIPVASPLINQSHREDLALKLLSPSLEVSNSELQQLIDEQNAILATINPKSNLLNEGPVPDLSKKLICEPIQKCDPVECQICLTNMIQPVGPSMNETFVFSCGHRFCCECSQNHLRSLIVVKNLQKLICPEQGCGKKVTVKEIRELFKNDKELFEKFIKFSKESRIDVMTRFCVREGCEGRMQAETMSAKRMSCPTCQTLVCFQCREAWHGYCTSCETAFNTNVGNQLGNPVVWCAVCRTKIVKNQGCDHITCSQCKYEFCYVCKEQWPCICKDIPIRNKAIRNIFLFLLLSIAIMAIPMFLVLALPVGCLVGFLHFFENEVEDRDIRKCCGCCIVPASLMSFLCGCMCNVIAIPIGLLVGPFFLAALAIGEYLRKIRFQNRARDRLSQQQKTQQQKEDAEFLL